MKKRDSIAHNSHPVKIVSDDSGKYSDIKLYKFGFWLFFFLVLFSVFFSIWAMSSIYSNFVVVKKILDESFDRTNFVMDVMSNKMIQCQQQINECRTESGKQTALPAP